MNRIRALAILKQEDYLVNATWVGRYKGVGSSRTIDCCTLIEELGSENRWQRFNGRFPQGAALRRLERHLVVRVAAHEKVEALLRAVGQGAEIHGLVRVGRGGQLAEIVSVDVSVVISAGSGLTVSCRTMLSALSERERY